MTDRSSKEILEAAKSEHFAWVDYTVDDEPFDADAEEGTETRIVFAPALNAGQIAEFEDTLPAELPSGIRELLAWSSGFDLGSHQLRFDRYNSMDKTQPVDWPYCHLLPHVVVLDDDGTGNHWVIEISPATGEWRHVWFQCHDPLAIVYQCETLSEFIDGVLDEFRLEKCRAGHRSILHNIGELCSRPTYRALATAGSLRTSADPDLADFAASLDDRARILDLRSPRIGVGFNPVFLRVSARRVQRDSKRPFIAVLPGKGLLARLFAR